MKILFALIIGAMTALPLSVSAAAEHTVQASFSGELTLLSIELPPIGIEGQLRFAPDQLRVEFTQDFTQESILLLVDFAKNNATVLYPDTLNGTTAELSNLSFAAYLQRLRDMLATAMGQQPPGWTLKNLGKISVEKQELSRIQLIHPEGAKVEYLLDSAQMLRSIEVETPGWLFVCELQDVVFDQEIDPAVFTYDADDYAVRQWQSEDAERLPPL